MNSEKKNNVLCKLIKSYAIIFFSMILEFLFQHWYLNNESVIQFVLFVPLGFWISSIEVKKADVFIRDKRYFFSFYLKCWVFFLRFFAVVMWLYSLFHMIS